jgi:HTH-type transcriptional regulator/antitoxin HigA
MEKNAKFRIFMLEIQNRWCRLGAVMTEESKYRMPGQLIRELMEAKGWNQEVLSIMLSRNKTVVNKTLTGKRALDAELAISLSELFGVSAERLMQLQKNYELAQARILTMDDPGRENRAHIFGNLPIAAMIKRGWINVADMRDVPMVEKEIMRFFAAPSADEIEILPHAAKRTEVFGGVTPVQLAWLYRVKAIASETMVARYSPSAVRESISKLKPLLASPQAARKVPRVLAECGIRYLIVESLPGAKIDGVCLWLNENSPVIGMSFRYDRIDNFWFVLRHEMEHVLQLHGQTAIMLDAELEGERAGIGDNLAEEERIANRAAADFCVPNRSLESFVARKFPIFRERDIIGFANTLNIHPGLVAGQLQRRIDRYDLFRNHLVKIKSAVAPSATVDGWGDVAPVGM